MKTTRQGVMWSAFGAIVFGVAGTGCELVATVDRDQIAGVGGQAGAGGGTGGVLGSGGDGQGGVDMTPDGSAGSSGGFGGDDTGDGSVDQMSVLPDGRGLDEDASPNLGDAPEVEAQGDTLTDQESADDADAGSGTADAADEEAGDDEGEDNGD